MIMPVAGPVGLGSAAAALDRGLMIIGVDTDQYVSPRVRRRLADLHPEEHGQSRVRHRSRRAIDGTLTLGDDYLGTLANGGVGLAAFHDFDRQGAGRAAR